MYIRALPYVLFHLNNFFYWAQRSYKLARSGTCLGRENASENFVSELMNVWPTKSVFAKKILTTQLAFPGFPSLHPGAMVAGQMVADVVGYSSILQCLADWTASIWFDRSDWDTAVVEAIVTAVDSSVTFPQGLTERRRWNPNETTMNYLSNVWNEPATQIRFASKALFGLDTGIVHMVWHSMCL